jgi:hypothetical protein
MARDHENLEHITTAASNGSMSRYELDLVRARSGVPFGDECCCHRCLVVLPSEESHGLATGETRGVVRMQRASKGSSTRSSCTDMLTRAQCRRSGASMRTHEIRALLAMREIVRYGSKE